MRATRALLSTFAFALTTALAPGIVLARTEEATSYTKTQAYNGALRLLRVDQALEITEKDPELGYVLFEYPTGVGAATTTGSVEVVERQDEVLVVVRIEKLPAHYESLLVQALLRKLETDYGAPPKRAPKPKADPKDKTPKDKPKDDADPSEPHPGEGDHSPTSEQ